MINIALHLGNVALAISGEVKEEKQGEVLAKGIASETYRAGASKVFGAKNHSRDEAFSPALAKDVEAAVNGVLSQVCDNLKIETSAYVPKPKLTVESVLASLSVEALQAAIAAKTAKEDERSEG